MLLDEIDTILKGGNGGGGIVSFGPRAKSGPDGGNGGAGGDLYLETSSDLTLLNQFTQKKIFQAQNGEMGGKNNRTGKAGDDDTIFIPVGTTIVERKTGMVLAEMDSLGEKIMIAKGGRGGRGNWEFRSARRTTPEFAQPGEKGEVKKVKLILKLIAQYGLIGLPNAGKTSLLNELTQASAKTANYAFTTLSPNLGVCNGHVLADIPGLIEGAHEGKGLGIKFLKHIEKTTTLLHCISGDSQDPMRDYKVIRDELKAYNPKLLKKKEIILITKSDLLDSDAINKIKKAFASKKIIFVSIHDWEGLEKLRKLLK